MSSRLTKVFKIPFRDSFADSPPDKFQEGWWNPGVEVTNAIELKKETPEEEAYGSLSFPFSLCLSPLYFSVYELSCGTAVMYGRYWVEFPKYGILAYTQRYIGTIYCRIYLSRLISLTLETNSHSALSSGKYLLVTRNGPSRLPIRPSNCAHHVRVLPLEGDRSDSNAAPAPRIPARSQKRPAEMDLHESRYVCLRVCRCLRMGGLRIRRGEAAGLGGEADQCGGEDQDVRFRGS
jgi:hypothetical protein